MNNDLIKQIYSWDWPDQQMVPDGYDMRTVPTATTRNIEVLTDKLNEVISILNELKELNQ